jgi:hypothetical protein
MNVKVQNPLTHPFRKDNHRQGYDLELRYLRFGFDLTFACLPVGRDFEI